MLAATLVCMTALAAQDWAPLGAFQADGKAKQLEPGRKLSECRFVGELGSSRIHTVVVRTDSEKKALRVARTLGPGEELVVPLEVTGKVTVLRISDGGDGTYRVFAR